MRSFVSEDVYLDVIADINLGYMEITCGAGFFGLGAAAAAVTVG